MDAEAQQALATLYGPPRVVRFKIHLPGHLADKLEAYAERHHEDVSQVVERALVRALRAQRL